jgi:hypothetical protein
VPKGHNVSSRSVWTPTATIDKSHAEIEAERSTQGHAERHEAPRWQSPGETVARSYEDDRLVTVQ